MNSRRILVPLDLRRNTSETLLYLQQAAPESPFCATLLYVVELNIATPDNHLYQEICAESEAALHNLAVAFLGHENAGSASESAALTNKSWRKPAPASPNSSF